MRQRRSTSRCRGLLLELVAMGVLVPAVGCGETVYLFSVVGGELNVLLHARPIGSVLAEGGLNETQRSRLAYIQEVRGFAIDALGLDAGGSYTTFFDTAGEPIAYTLTAAEKDRLAPYTWTFPLVGTLPYKGFFDLNLALGEQRALDEAGYDTLLVRTAGYSTGGVFRDPVHSRMLEYDEIDLANLVIHELTHNTVLSGDTSFNESLATFVERAGGLRFLEHKFGPDAEIIDQARGRLGDRDAFNELLFQLHAKLTALYEEDLTRDEKISQRELIFADTRANFESQLLPELHDPQRYQGRFQYPLNNAWVLAFYRYNLNLHLFEAVLEAVSGDFKTAIEVFRKAAAERDPWPFLEAWLEQRAPQP